MLSRVFPITVWPQASDWRTLASLECRMACDGRCVADDKHLLKTTLKLISTYNNSNLIMILAKLECYTIKVQRSECLCAKQSSCLFIAEFLAVTRHTVSWNRTIIARHLQGSQVMGLIESVTLLSPEQIKHTGRPGPVKPQLSRFAFTSPAATMARAAFCTSGGASGYW